MTKLTEIYNYLFLNDTLLTGGQPTWEQFLPMATAGIKTVINLALATSANALPEEDLIVKRLEMEYIHIPVVWENPTEADLDKFNLAMDKQSGNKVFVHCAANMRVSAFVALYRILRLGWDREKAFQDTYRIWDPFEDAVWGKFIESVLGK